jgi:predicted ATPase
LTTLGAKLPLNDEMRRLGGRWGTGSGWPKRLRWIEIDGIRGWHRERIEFNYPITAIVGENGVGKSTILQCAAAVYAPTDRETTSGRYASDFFPDTAWERIRLAEIRFQVRDGNTERPGRINRPSDRWRGNRERPERHVEYYDLSRVTPVSGRPGFSRLAKSEHTEVGASPFDQKRLARYSQVMGRAYEGARASVTNFDDRRPVPVLQWDHAQFSSFHQGSGETTVFELLQADVPPTGLLVIDEIETSLHPKVQRRLIGEIARMCRERDLQVILTTHSATILDELPPEARVFVLPQPGARRIIYGVSPEYAMSSMDDVPHYECDLFVEDMRAKIMLTELLTAADSDMARQCQVIPAGAASVCTTLGLMVGENKFPRPTRVFLDGDQGGAYGCHVLPGDDAPEPVVFKALAELNWAGLDVRVGRALSDVIDACRGAMTLTNHHDWVGSAASRLSVGTEMLWNLMCSEWVKRCVADETLTEIRESVADALRGQRWRLPAARETKRSIVRGESSQTIGTAAQLLPLFSAEVGA